MAIAGRFVRSDGASSAIEFAVIAPVLLAIVFSTFEFGWTVIQKNLLDRAVDLSIRSIRVGDASAPKTMTDLRTNVCAKTILLKDCAKSLIIEMTDITNSAVPTSATPCINKSSKIEPVVNFTPGGRGSIMYVRFCWTTKPISPLIGLAALSPTDGKGNYFIISASAFVNEPAQ